MIKQIDSFDLLTEKYQLLIRAGEGSLEAAYAFGAVVNALHDVGFSYRVLGDHVGLGFSQVSVYAKLFRKFPTTKRLLVMARELHTYDVSRLAGDGDPSHYTYAWSCQNCGSSDVKKVRQDEEAVPAYTGDGSGMDAVNAVTPVPARTAR